MRHNLWKCKQLIAVQEYYYMSSNGALQNRLIVDIEFAQGKPRRPKTLISTDNEFSSDFLRLQERTLRAVTRAEGHW